jgi:hypothetical protein
MLWGVTGSGKTTTTYFLRGDALIKKEVKVEDKLKGEMFNKLVYEADDPDEDLVIGHK